MKRILLTGLIIAAACGTLFAQASKSAVDFKKDELLCGKGDGSPMEAEYGVAKVLKTASAETKNQYQALYIQDGSKDWVDFVIPTHKAKKEELGVDAVVLYPSGWAEYSDMGIDDYRKARWFAGLITAVDELFKDLVEIDGQKYNWKFIRVPDDPASLEPKNE